MRSLNSFLILTLVFSLVSCSSKKKKEEVSEAAAVVQEDNVEEFMIDEDIADPAPQVEVKEEMSSSSGPIEAYTVQEGDTLMLVSFKIYGDYRRWREIANQNPNIESSGLKQGMVLNYVAPEEKFQWNPQGLPHMIRNGETLGTISSDKYGTTKKWKDIWENNKPMIINPNLIFSGFTLYYKPKEEVISKVTK